LVPKWIGPYRITWDFGNNSYKVDLSTDLKQQGVHNVFHASLLQFFHPNDDRLFPGRLDAQIINPEAQSIEWAADKILSHSRSRSEAIFEVLWKSGDVS
ncbi:hypothetical protein JAAARDRAFT_88842, partial [Jaapia argillacea MUCL 33604]